MINDAFPSCIMTDDYEAHPFDHPADVCLSHPEGGLLNLSFPLNDHLAASFLLSVLYHPPIARAVTQQPSKPKHLSPPCSLTKPSWTNSLSPTHPTIHPPALPNY